MNRRAFLHHAAITTAAAAIARDAFALAPRATTDAHLKFGYASITWSGNDLLAIDEISALGWAGIQLRSNILPQFGNTPLALHDLLASRHLTFVALSSGSVNIDPNAEAATVAEHVAHANFVHDAGGLFLQVTDDRPPGRPITNDDCSHLGRILTEIGKRTAALGVRLAYHPHMGTIGERPADLERILGESDSRCVELLLDVAHYTQGGGDPAAAIRRHHDRLAFIHLKDVQPVAANADNPAASNRFVELGRGRVDLDGVFAALRDVNYDEWLVVELDSVTGHGHSANDAAVLNKRFVESHGFAVGNGTPR